MSEARAYTVEFLGTDRPQSVSINGTKCSNGVWNYDAQSRQVTVYVPITACSETIKIELN